jgi:G:T/U-mismatch repair DNA glycosylase
MVNHPRITSCKVCTIDAGHARTLTASFDCGSTEMWQTTSSSVEECPINDLQASNRNLEDELKREREARRELERKLRVLDMQRDRDRAQENEPRA